MKNFQLTKKVLLSKIDWHRNSKAVKSFFLNGHEVWLDNKARMSLMNSLNIFQEAGEENVTIWFEDLPIELNTGAAIQILKAVEQYAMKCYQITKKHKQAIEALTTEDEINSYDYTVGYPEKLNFNI